MALVASVVLAATTDVSATDWSAERTLMSTASAQTSSVRPFQVGERAEYSVKFGIFNAGGGSLQFSAIDTVRGRPAFRFTFVIRGGVNALVFRYQLTDTLMSWVDTARFQTLLHVREKREGGDRESKRIEFFPERLTYSENGKAEVPSMPDPLDEISFLYFVRTLQLRVGDTLSFPRYYRPDRNPVKLVVLRKELVDVHTGKYMATVVQPIFKARGGIFSEGGKAEVWIADDSTRAIVQLKTHLKFGSLTMQLKSYRPAEAAATRRTP